MTAGFQGQGRTCVLCGKGHATEGTQQEMGLDPRLNRETGIRELREREEEFRILSQQSAASGYQETAVPVRKKEDHQLEGRVNHKTWRGRGGP